MRKNPDWKKMKKKDRKKILTEYENNKYNVK